MVRLKLPLPECRRHLVFLATAALCALAAGCGSLGPKTLDKDQLDYGHSIGNSWKNQMLANIVKMRFVDMPVFVDVSSIVSGYTLQTQVTGRLGFGDSLTGGDSQGLDASGTYTDRPTISYTPKTGDDYLRSLLHPVEPTNLLALLQAGYSAQLLFTWSVEAVNGLHNYAESASGNRQADPQFYEYISLLQDLQDAGAIGFEIDKKAESGENIILVMHKQGLSEAIRAKRQRTAELLGLDPTRNRFTVIYAPFSPDNETLAMQTRSVLKTLAAMSGFVDVPDSQQAYALPGFQPGDGLERPFHVHSGPERPEESFASILYKDYWYWIDDADIASKRVFTLMLFMTTLTNKAGSDRGPILTIPTG